MVDLRRERRLPVDDEDAAFAAFADQFFQEQAFARWNR